MFFESEFTGCKERDIRWLGLLLQVLGFVVVARQLTTLRRLFRKPSFLLRITNYWGSFPSRYIKKIAVAANVVSGPATVAGSISVKASANAPLEKRVELLESEIGGVKQNLSRVQTALSSHQTASRESMDQVREEIRTGIEKLEKLMDQAVVGGIVLEWAGIIYFLAGIVLATGAPEISVLLGYTRQCSQ